LPCFFAFSRLHHGSQDHQTHGLDPQLYLHEIFLDNLEEYPKLNSPLQKLPAQNQSGFDGEVLSGQDIFG
jgi:hypothetical protein